MAGAGASDTSTASRRGAWPAPTVMRGAVALDVVDEALRAVNTHMRLAGVTGRQARDWVESACWFPDLCSSEHPWYDALQALRAPFAFLGEVWTQLLLQFPHPPGVPVPELVYHVDEQREGAEFYRVAGVALTPSDGFRGGIRFPGEPALTLRPGDAVVFDAAEPHSGGVNLSGAVRYAVYFRWLNPHG